MATRPEPLFLERRNYRQRRLGDAARILPLFGFFLMMMPILWREEATTAGGMIYLFTVWAVLIAIVAVLSLRLKETDQGSDDSRPADPGPH